MATGTSTTHHFRGSRGKLFGLAVLGIGMTLLGAVLAFPDVAGLDLNPLHQVAGWAALIFFGACTVAIIGRFLRAGESVVRISPAGIVDIRVAPDTIAWPRIHSISTWSYGSQRMLVLGIDPELEERLRLTPMVRWTRPANRMLGADGLIINAAGLNVSHDALAAIVTAYHAAYGPHRPDARRGEADADG